MTDPETSQEVNEQNGENCHNQVHSNELHNFLEHEKNEIRAF